MKRRSLAFTGLALTAAAILALMAGWTAVSQVNDPGGVERAAHDVEGTLAAESTNNGALGAGRGPVTPGPGGELSTTVESASRDRIAAEATFGPGVPDAGDDRPGTPVTISLDLRILSATGEVPDRIALALKPDRLRAQRPIGVSLVGEDGVVRFRRTYSPWRSEDADELDAWATGGELVAGDDASTVNDGRHQVWIASSLAASPSTERLLGRIPIGPISGVPDGATPGEPLRLAVTLRPPTRVVTIRFPEIRRTGLLGTLRTRRPEASSEPDPVDAVRSNGRPPEPDDRDTQVIGRGRLVRSRHPFRASPEDVEVLVHTFEALETWSLVVNNPGEGEAFRAEGRVGESCEVRFPEPTGLWASVNYAAYPRVARAVIVDGQQGLSAARLGADSFDKWESDAIRALMVPLPGRRGDKDAYTFGQIPMPDGFYRFELWSLLDKEGHRTRLDSRTFALEDGRVDVTF